MSVFRVVKDKENPYVLMNKTFLNDINLSWKAKGLLAYILSLPDDWQLYETELVKHSKDGKDSLKSAIKELIDQGYIHRGDRIRNEKGHVTGYDYKVFEIPNHDGKSVVGKSNAGESNVGKPANTNIITELNNNKNNIIPCEVEEVSEKNKIDYKAIVEEYNSITGVTKVRSLTDKRKKQLNARLKEHGEDSLNIVMQNIKTSDFLRGYNKTNWKMDFDWLVNPNNYIKILEGKYNKQNSTNNAVKTQSNINRPTVKTEAENEPKPAWQDWD